MQKKIGMLAAFFMMLQLMFVSISEASVYGTKKSETKKTVSPEVTHIQQTYQGSSTRQFINILDVNLNHTYTDIEIGLPNPKNSLQTTSNIVKQYNAQGHRVVGAVNASYFLSNGMPANLIAIENEIINYGILGTNTESPSQKPVAFGISKNGTAIIDYYTTTMKFTIDGKSYPIKFIDTSNVSGINVLHTAEKETTGYYTGLELVFSKSTVNTEELHFGQRFTAVLQKKTTGNSTIPKDGFVISIADQAAKTALSAVAPGSKVEVSIQIDSKWQDAEFILAAGPLLVKDGKQEISMPLNTSFVTSRHPRTAVAVDSTGKRVFLVTVDGRQPGHSNGTSLTNLASQLISMGAKAAINLDGGGSTTMLARSPGLYSPILVNKPSDSSERRVSAILQVVNNAPTGTPKHISLQSVGELVPGDTVNMKVINAYDEYYNPMWVTPEMMSWTVEGNIGEMNGNIFKATNSGTGKIIGTYKGKSFHIPVTVKDLKGAPYILNSMDSLSSWKVSAVKSTATLNLSSKSEPWRQGTSALKLAYDFTTGEAGTKAAYAIASTPISILSKPEHIGVWVYGDGKTNWLRGIVIDSNGTKHTINFTEENKLNFTGWKYVTAQIPSNAVAPYKFDRLYVVQTNASLQSKGELYFDKLQAVYDDTYVEPYYTDVAPKHWAYSAINDLNNRGLVKGYTNGTFKPSQTITRAEAAVIMARALNLSAKKTTEYRDVAKSHYAYDAIQAVSEAGIFTGRVAGEFSPNGHLTRAETASVLKRAFKLSGDATISFSDLNANHWAYESVKVLMANGLVDGYPDNTFRPSNTISRAEFASFLSRTLK